MEILWTHHAVEERLRRLQISKKEVIKILENPLHSWVGKFGLWCYYGQIPGRGGIKVVVERLNLGGVLKVITIAPRGIFLRKVKTNGKKRKSQEKNHLRRLSGKDKKIL